MRIEGQRLCPECGMTVDDDGTCRKHPKTLYPFYVPMYSFGDHVRDLVHLLKYSGRRDVGRFFGGKISDILSDNGPFASADGLVPVPLHKVRQRERGYNQSEVIAEQISTITGVPILAKAVKRVRMTKSQTKLDRNERRSNVAGAFRASEELDGRKVIILDDVITTGATTREVALAITNTGGKVLCALCVAHPLIEESREYEL